MISCQGRATWSDPPDPRCTRRCENDEREGERTREREREEREKEADDERRIGRRRKAG